MIDYAAVHTHNHAIGRELPPGWWRLYDQTMLKLAELDPGRRVTRVREKGAAMRIDVELWPSPEVRLLLMEVARRSKTVCDICGGEGHPVRTGSGWWRTRCSKHELIWPGFQLRPLDID